MPFETANALQVGTDKNDIILTAYIADWISNAPSILHYTQDGVVPVGETIPPPPSETATQEPADGADTDDAAEAAPLDIDEETTEETANDESNP